MLALSSQWLLDLTGRLHPLMVHFPIGLLAGAWLIEVYNRLRKRKIDLTEVICLGAGTAFLAALMGQLLYSDEAYSGEEINRHQILGWLTAVLSLLTAATYLKREKLPGIIPFIALSVTTLSLSLAGHYGATITHGSDYLSSVFVTKNLSVHNQSLKKWIKQDSFSLAELDQLNLEVRAIFAHNCYQCHSTAKRKGGLALDHEEGVFTGGDYGPILVKGSAAESEIIRRLQLPRNQEEAMPPKGKVLPEASIKLIELWIDQGAHWAEDGLKIFREAPITLEKPNLPSSPNKMDHPVDKLVDTYFAKNKINWPEPIDDRRFVRKAYLDITGLLPSPDNTQAFIQNKASDKRAVLIDSLLADNENYTLHWLSFWNDLLRNDYSGPGFITNGRKQITDWLYESLISNKPYDKMVRELISPTSESAGFIEGIQWRGVVNASQRTELQAAQNISQSLLGLNLKCASCHNSFINNLTLDQAYGFANIFADTPLEIYRCDKPTGRIAKTTFIYPELGEIMADSLVDRLRQLADIISQPKNGRLYRTIVNRFWDQLFGRGIVSPTDEMDKIPWNQDLLDWLAASFRETNDLKQLLRVIMTSKTYQLPALDYGSSEYVASENFAFRGPIPRRLSAEQLADAISQKIQPLYHGVAYLPGDPVYPAQWIWFQDVELDRNSMPKPGDRYFRKILELTNPNKISRADILITADHAFELMINGQLIGQGTDWKQVNKYSLPIHVLSRQNLIAVKGTNDGNLPNPAGLLFALKLTYPDNSHEYIYSDRTWLSTDKKPPGNWTEWSFNDSDWKKVSSRGNSGDWGKLPRFQFNNEDSTSFVRAALVKLDPFLKAMGRPTRENVSTNREENVTLLQAILVNNHELLHKTIEKGARQWLSLSGNNTQQLTETIFLQLLGRTPTSAEQSAIQKQLKDQIPQTAIEDLIWSLILLPEFQFI